MRMNRITFVAIVSAVCSIAAIAWATRHPWNAQPLTAGGITIQPTDVYSNGRGILTVHTNFVNQGQAPIMVNRDLITATLPTGRAIQRGQGAFTQHETYVIMGGGGMHPVFFDFNERDVAWEGFSEVQVNWGQAVTINGAPVALPPLVLHP